MAGIGDCELKIGMGGGPVFIREGDHLGRSVYAKHRALRDALGNGGGGLAVATADVEDAFIALERQD